ncbi:hypothetical protein BGZ79_000131 [Entomortierella chlamydospora]|nr:hypothetical protein BGZ79_000131 [Entomortierella chlamydospora]
MGESIGSQLSPLQSPQLSPGNSTTTSLAKVQTIAQARTELEARLAGIHNDLQLTQTIGLLFVKREEDLKKCFEQLEQEGVNQDTDEEAEGQPLPESLREQLTALEKEFQEGENGIVGLKRLIDAQLPVDSNTNNELQTSRSGSTLAPSALPSSALPVQTITKPRRHKVVMSSAPSVNDAAFPLQIQEELLTQVRYWTSQAEMKEKLNQEYDAKINEQERIIDALNKQRRMREESEEKQKEDQWKLELQNQGYRDQIAELQAQLSKMTHENGKTQKALAAATEQAEQFKDKEEKTSHQFELAKTRFEKDIAILRKHAAGVQREKADLITKVDELNAAISLQQQELSKKATLEAIAAARELEEKEQESAAPAPVLIVSPPRVPDSEEAAQATTTTASAAAAAAAAVSTLEPKVASLARETSFAHQQSIISELQSKLNKEITEKEELITANEELVTAKEELLIEKEELVKMLADREETIETMRLEGVTFEPDTPSKRSSMALLGGPGSRHPSESGLLDETETADHRDLSMTMSDNGSHDFSNGRNSPFPAGGLFAELAQATSHSNVKPTVECKDQEVMTEPIESWIHTVPGLSSLLKEASSSHNTSEEASPIEASSSHNTSEEASPIEAPSSQITSEEASPTEALNVSEAATIRGKPGTDTMRIEALPVSESHVSDIPVNAVVDVISQDDSPQIKEDQVHQSESLVGGLKPRSGLSPAADEERRHTCDLSQTMVESVTPLVPEASNEPSDEHPALQNPEDREFRVSFGSAFGGDSKGADTGRIRSVYMDNETEENQISPEKHDEEPSEKLTEKPAELSVAEPTEKLTEKPAESSVVEPMVVAGAVAAAATAAVVSKVAKQEESSSSDDGASSSIESRIRNGQEEGKEEEAVTHSVVEPSQEPSEKIGHEVGVSSTSQQSVQPDAVVSVTSQATYMYDQNSSQVLLSNLNGSTHHHHVITDATGTTIGHHNYHGSPSGSISSISTDYHNVRRMSVGSNYDVTPTDPTMIQLITQTMIGDYLMKYTRRRMANMISEKTHNRYVWVHPYTKTMYWSMNNPGAEGSREQRVKSVRTTNRDLKLRAPTREKHDLWFRSISYLLSRPNTPGSDLQSDNQTWSDVQANNNNRGTSGAAPANDTVLNLRQSEKVGQTLRNKASLTRLFSRNSVSKEGGINFASGPSSSVGQSRVVLSRFTPISGSHNGITTTAAAVSDAGNGNRNEKSDLTNSVVVADGKPIQL